MQLVESAHFPAQVQQLVKGSTSMLGDDISYVLNAYPNHPKALVAMARLGEKEKTDRPLGALFSVDCYFERAMSFSPTDPLPFLIYGNYLARNGRGEDALKRYQEAEKLDPANPNVLYSMGLLFFKSKQYDQAQAYAKKAYDQGYPLPGLRRDLEKIGKWDDPKEDQVAK